MSTAGSKTLPLPKADNYSLSQSFSMSFREIHTTCDWALNFLLFYILSVIFNLFFFLWQHEEYALSVLKKENYLCEDWLARNTCIFVNEPQRLLPLKKEFWEKKITETYSCFSYQYWSSSPFFFINFLPLRLDQIPSLPLSLINSNISCHSGEEEKIKFIIFIS